MRRMAVTSFLILFLLTVVPSVGLLNAGGLKDYDQKEEFSKTLPLKDGGIFSLKNVNGFIHIETWNRNEVEIYAEKAVRGRRENLDKITIEIDSGASFVRVDTVFPKISTFRGRVNYEIKVPAGIELGEIRTVNGNVIITGPLGDVEAASTNGNVSVSDISGRMALTTTNGSIKAVDVTGEIRARSTNGSIHLSVGSVTEGISARTTNGGITLSIETRSIDADLEARTTNGSIQVDFPITIQAGWNSKRNIEGKIGDGGSLISLKTTNGSIKIND